MLIVYRAETCMTIINLQKRYLLEGEKEIKSFNSDLVRGIKMRTDTPCCDHRNAAFRDATKAAEGLLPLYSLRRKGTDLGGVKWRHEVLRVCRRDGLLQMHEQ